jgi:hypothetical protein
MAAQGKSVLDVQENASSELATFFKQRMTLCSKELTGVRRNTRNGEFLLPNTSTIDAETMLGFEATIPRKNYHFWLVLFVRPIRLRRVQCKRRST